MKCELCDARCDMLNATCDMLNATCDIVLRTLTWKYKAVQDMTVKSLCCWWYREWSIASYISFWREESNNYSWCIFVWQIPFFKSVKSKFFFLNLENLGISKYQIRGYINKLRYVPFSMIERGFTERGYLTTCVTVCGEQLTQVLTFVTLRYFTETMAIIRLKLLILRSKHPQTVTHFVRPPPSNYIGRDLTWFVYTASTK